MNLFQCLDYKLFLRFQVKREAGQYGYKSRLAEAAGCQKSFLSQVLNGSVHLTLEHALGMATFWQLGAAETDYFYDLVSLARAATREHRDYLQAELKRLRNDHENLAKRFSEAATIPDADAAIYYSTWHYTAIHYLLSADAYQTKERICQRLNCSEETVSKVLNQLQKMGLARSHGQRWSMDQRSFHLPKDSSFSAINHSHWRTRAVENSFAGNERDIHYTSVGTIDLEALKTLRQMTFDYIASMRKTIGASGAEDLFCFSCDFFRV